MTAQCFMNCISKTVIINLVLSVLCWSVIWDELHHRELQSMILLYYFDTL